MLGNCSKYILKYWILLYHQNINYAEDRIDAHLNPSPLFFLIFFLQNLSLFRSVVFKCDKGTITIVIIGVSQKIFYCKNLESLTTKTDIYWYSNIQISGVITFFQGKTMTRLQRVTNTFKLFNKWIRKLLQYC